MHQVSETSAYIAWSLTTAQTAPACCLCHATAHGSWFVNYLTDACDTLYNLTGIIMAAC